MKKLSIKETLEKNGFIIYPFEGTSMLPLLVENEDKVHIKKDENFEVNDVVLFEPSKNHFVLHRIIEIKDDKYYIIGDNASKLDIIEKSKILGKMVGFYKKTEYFELDRKEYIEYVNQLLFSNEFNKNELLKDPEDFFFSRQMNALFEIINLEINNELKNPDKINQLLSFEKREFLTLIKEKKALHYLGLAVSKFGVHLTPKLDKLAVNAFEEAKLRYIRSEEAMKKVSELFTRHGIKHAFLKGAELRKLYPEPFYRMSNDLDVLVSKEDFKTARKLITGVLGGKFYASTPHDDSFIVDSLLIMIELHHSISTDLPKDLKYLLDNTLENANKVGKYQCVLTNTDMMLINLSHAAKHINNGEFWLNMLTDTYFLNKLEYDKSKIMDARLNKFHQTLNGIILCAGSYNNLGDKDKSLLKFLFAKGEDIHMMLQKGKYHSKFSYVMHRIFVPYRALTPRHPLLKKVPILLPFYEIARWIAMPFKHKKWTKHYKEEISDFQKKNSEEINVLIDSGLEEYIIRVDKSKNRF